MNDSDERTASALLRQVRETIDRWQLLEAGETVVLGVSGGADSLCLLHALRALAGDYGVALHVGHLHHGLRGEEADADATFVASLCEAWGLPCTVAYADVRALARQGRLSIEETARQARYRFLGGLARSLGARSVAVAHQADDQVETVLMHLLRGAGLAGLRGMRPLARLDALRLDALRLGDADLPPIRLLRPLLEVTRAQVAAYCRARGLSPRFDRSNLDTTHYRNRLRHELLPLLETYNPAIRQVLRRTAEAVAADHALLRAVLDEAWARVVRRETDGAIVLDTTAFRAQPLALRRALLREAIHRLRRSLRNINWVHVEDAVRLAERGQTGDMATLPSGLALTLGYDALTVAPVGYAPVEDDQPRIQETLPVPLEGELSLPGGEWVLRTALLPRDALPDDWARHADPYLAYLDADRLTAPLCLRPRRPGDWLLPLGLGGRQKVGDLMTNCKIPRYRRDTAPLLVCGDEIAWVAGYRLDARYTVGPETRIVLCARMKRGKPS
jgi:tRNA(Ile)-lysidine synthase